MIRSGGIRWLAVVLLLCLFATADAAPGDATALRPAQAATQIETMLAEVESQHKEANSRYYDGAAYLEALFREAAVYPRAMQYAASWGDNAVYLNWVAAEGFYKAHADALRTSLALARNGRAISAADIEYLAAGVRSWRGEEALIDDDLARSARLYAQQARKLGERMAIDDALGPLASTAARARVEPQRQELAEQAEVLRGQAIAAARAGMERAKRRLFSPLDARQRIAIATDVPETENACETHEREDIVDTKLAFDRLEQSLRTELEAGHEK